MKSNSLILLIMSSFGRSARATKLDYRALNDGTDDEADMEDRIDLSPVQQSQPISSFDSQLIE